MKNTDINTDMRVPGCVGTGADNRSYPTSESGRQPRGATPRPRSSASAGTGGLRGATPCPRSGGAAVRRHPSFTVRKAAALCWSSREEIPHVKGKRNPSKMVGVVRGHQRADTLKAQSQKTSQSNHTRTTAFV